MISIRLSRGGAKKRPFYRIVVAERSASRDGRFIEVIGTSNPMAAGKEPALAVKLDRYDYWCGQGAQPSLTVKRLCRQYRRGGGAGAADAKPAAAAKPDAKPAAAAPTDSADNAAAAAAS